jgi:hypothetical protein
LGIRQVIRPGGREERISVLRFAQLPEETLLATAKRKRRTHQRSSIYARYNGVIEGTTGKITMPQLCSPTNFCIVPEKLIRDMTKWTQYRLSLA